MASDATLTGGLPCRGPIKKTGTWIRKRTRLKTGPWWQLPAPTRPGHIAGNYHDFVSGLRYQLTAMGTQVEGPIDELLKLTKQLHDATFEASKGTDRVVTHLRLDERRGEPLTLEGKVMGALGLRPDQK